MRLYLNFGLNGELMVLKYSTPAAMEAPPPPMRIPANEPAETPAMNPGGIHDDTDQRSDGTPDYAAYDRPNGDPDDHPDHPGVARRLHELLQRFVVALLARLRPLDNPVVTLWPWSWRWPPPVGFRRLGDVGDRVSVAVRPAVVAVIGNESGPRRGSAAA